MGEGNAALLTKCGPTAAWDLALSGSVLHVKPFNWLQCACDGLRATFVPLGLLGVPGEGQHLLAPGVFGGRSQRLLAKRTNVPEHSTGWSGLPRLFLIF